MLVGAGLAGAVHRVSMFVLGRNSHKLMANTLGLPGLEQELYGRLLQAHPVTWSAGVTKSNFRSFYTPRSLTSQDARGRSQYRRASMYS
jgi:hypothetical protein